MCLLLYSGFRIRNLWQSCSKPGPVFRTKVKKKEKFVLKCIVRKHRSSDPFTLLHEYSWSLAVTNVGSTIPALMRSQDQKKCLKVVVLSDFRLYQAAFPAFYTSHFKSFQCCLPEATKWISKKCPNLHFVLFFWRTRFKNMKGKSVKKGRDWIMEKKERRRRQGRCACSWKSANPLTKIFLFGMLSYHISLLTVDTSPLCFFFICLQGGSCWHEIHGTSEETSFLASHVHVPFWTCSFWIRIDLQLYFKMMQNKNHDVSVKFGYLWMTVFKKTKPFFTEIHVFILKWFIHIDF